MKYLEEIYSEIFKKALQSETTSNVAYHYMCGLSHRYVHLLLYMSKKDLGVITELSNKLIGALKKLNETPTLEQLKEFNVTYGLIVPQFYRTFGPIYDGYS